MLQIARIKNNLHVIVGVTPLAIAAIVAFTMAGGFICAEWMFAQRFAVAVMSDVFSDALNKSVACSVMLVEERGRTEHFRSTAQTAFSLLETQKRCKDGRVSASDRVAKRSGEPAMVGGIGGP